MKYGIKQELVKYASDDIIEWSEGFQTTTNNNNMAWIVSELRSFNKLRTQLYN